MIKSESIFKAIQREINSVFADILVTAEPVTSTEGDYCRVTFKSVRKNYGYGLIERFIKVDLAVVVRPSEFLEVTESELYYIADTFDALFCAALLVEDRFFTINDTNYNIFDRILHYRFELAFSDVVESQIEELSGDFELMEELKLKIDA